MPSVLPRVHRSSARASSGSNGGLGSGLVYCAECGGRMAAIGQDYLACSAARSSAGCTNRTSIKRSRIEQVVLESLKAQLMAPELVAEFVRDFHDEINKALDLRKGEHEAELARVTKKLKGLYD